MKVPARIREQGISLNLTPLIDIVFLLVIFFLVASHGARTASTEPVDLPVATRGENQATSSPDRLVVTVTADHLLHVAGRVVTLDAIRSVLDATREDAMGSFEVRIRGDRLVPFHVVEPLMIACAEAGVTRVGYAVLPH
ncbi:MAG: biopolymer transporter ExbD [Planctomycetaceae bacterium]|nr:biopolymer transporter ExbD [Planctomycetaceae bacterium]